MHTRLTGRLNGRIMGRGKARGGDGGAAADTDLLPAVHAQPAGPDAGAGAAKGDLSRKPAPLVPGQAPLGPVPATSAARLCIPAVAAGGATGLVAAPPLGGAGSKAKTPLPSKHRRSHSAGLPPAAGQLQPLLSDDLGTYVDAGPANKDVAAQQQQQPAPLAADDSLQRRSRRLAAAAAAAADPAAGLSIKAAGGAGGGGGAGARALARASAPARAARHAAPQGAGARGLAATAAAALGMAAAALAPSASRGPAAPAAAAAAAAPAPAPSPLQARAGGRRVSFAPGPLDPARAGSTQDGHPASEGLLAVPVRRVPASYGMDLSRGNVLMLEQLLGGECAMSVTRLKRRVGLLPPIRPPRPHATTQQRRAGGAAGPTAGGGAAAAGAAAAGAAGHHAPRALPRGVSAR